MARQPIIAANWKMNITPNEAETFMAEFIPLVNDSVNVDIVLCPSALVVDRVSRKAQGTNISVGGQNVYFEQSGAYTGENSVVMLNDLQCEYVILGHSERRAIFGESNEVINKKVKLALKSGLKVILCIGESLEQREADETESVIEDHITNSLKDLTTEDMENIIIAYEPVWAIGTGKTATPEQAEEAHAFTRELIGKLFDDNTKDAVRIQYGGSVKPDNVKELMSKENIDGALVGGASLKAESFSKIVNF